VLWRLPAQAKDSPPPSEPHYNKVSVGLSCQALPNGSVKLELALGFADDQAIHTQRIIR